MGKYEVTQGEWEKLMGDNPSQFKGSDRLPVERVTWKDCEEYARKAGDGLALPTEAEWEHACRAGTRTRFHYGDDDDELGEYAWFESNSGSRTHDVGQKSPNAWGLYDMHGNVQEWCRDWYGGKYYAESPGNDPTGPKEGVHRVLRGGCWSGLRWHCRSAIRTWYAPGVRYGLIGLRLSLDPK
jgi:formylglycine-generating enzyme required for sulfatase activity